MVVFVYSYMPLFWHVLSPFLIQIHAAYFVTITRNEKDITAELIRFQEEFNYTLGLSFATI